MVRFFTDLVQFLSSKEKKDSTELFQKLDDMDSKQDM